MVVLTVLVLSYHTFPSSSHSLASVFLTIDSLRVTSPGGYSSTRIREAGQVGQARTMMEDWGQISEFLYLYPTLSHYIILCLHINCHYCKYVERETHTLYTYIIIYSYVSVCLNLLRWDHYSDIMYIYIYICIWVTVDVQFKVWLLACWWQHSPQQHGFHTLVMCCVHHHCLFYIGVVLHSLRDTKAGYVPLFPGPNCFSP